MIPIIHINNILIVVTLGVPSFWKRIYRLKATQACSLQNSFASWLVFNTPCQAEPHNHPPHALLANSGRHLHSFSEFYEKHNTIWATQLSIAVYVKQRSSSFAKESCCKEVSFATAVVSHILHYSLSFIITSPLTISSEASSFGGIYWSVSWRKVFLPCLFLIPRFFSFQ